MLTHRPSRTLPATNADGKPLRPTPLGFFTQAETAAILTYCGMPITQSGVALIEKRSLAKLAAHPVLRRLFSEVER